MKAIKYTNIGPRKANEDSFYVSNSNEKIFACIADGVGGLTHGEFASNYVKEEFAMLCKRDEEPDLVSFISKANKDLIKIAKSKFNVEIIGTTFTGGIISRNRFWGVHVGDSRACVLRKNGIKQLTNEQNEVGRLISEGKIKSSDKKYYPRKNIIESIVGSEELFKVQKFEFDLLINDRIILSSDGFHETLTKKEIRDISVKIPSLDEFCRRLIIEIENRILHDNTTFICIEI